MNVLKNRFTVVSIKRKSRGEGFKELKVGDTIEISVPIASTGQRGKGGGGCYAAYCKIEFSKQGTSVEKSLNNLALILRNIELEEVR